MFKVTLGKGFQMTFTNGWTVSVQFGARPDRTNTEGIVTVASD